MSAARKLESHDPTRIAVVASGITSPLFSMLELATRFREAGHDVRIFAPEHSAARISHAGFEQAVIPEPKVWAYGSLVEGKGLFLGQRAKRTAQAVKNLEVSDFLQALKTFGPKLIVVDCELHAHFIASLSLDVPVVLSNNMFLSPPSDTAPPLGSTTVPGRGLAGSRLGVRFQWFIHYAKKLSSMGRRKILFGGADHPTALNQLSQDLRIKVRNKRLFQSWQYPWTYDSPTILLLPRVLDLPTKLHRKMTYLGPMIWENRPQLPHNDNSIREFCTPNADKKKIYAAFGSMLTPDSTFITNLWRAVERHKDWELLCVVGEHWQAKPNSAVPENVRLVEWAPQLDVLAAADLVLFHGGAGTLVEAAVSGTPMLIYPHVLDEFGNGARCVYHGLGLMGDKRDGVAKMENDISKILLSPEFKIASTRMKAACEEGQSIDIMTEIYKLLAR